VTLAYLLLHENRHHFVSKEHSLAGQAEARFGAPQAAGFEKRLEFGAKPAPDINSVPSLYGIYVDSVSQSQPREQRVAQPLVRSQAPPVDGQCTPAPGFGDVIRRAGDVLPPDALPCGVRTATEAEPLAVGPVLEVMPRCPAWSRHVRDLVLDIACLIQPLHRP